MRSPLARPRMASISARTGSMTSSVTTGRSWPRMSSAIWRPARRPKTSRSTSEFVPRRLAPWTDTQAASPAAYRPGTTVLAASRVAWRQHVGGDPAHRVVRRRLDRDRVRVGLDALVDPDEVRDVRQLLVDHLAPEVAHVEVDVVLAVDAAARADLLDDGPADHVARGQLHELGGVALHEPEAVVVEEVGALAARGLGQEDPDAHDAGRDGTGRTPCPACGTPCRYASATPSPVRL